MYSLLGIKGGISLNWFILPKCSYIKSVPYFQTTKVGSSDHDHDLAMDYNHPLCHSSVT